MEHVKKVLDNTDWTLLAAQKRMLIEMDSDEAAGLVNFLDALQDAAVAAGYPVVWLSEDDEPITGMMEG